MNYIGSKQKLAPWIKEIITSVYKSNLNEAVFADIFAGTGQVSRYLKKDVRKIIVNDIEKYSFILNKHYIGNCKKIELDLSKLNLEKINHNYNIKYIISNNFSEIGKEGRKYFSKKNAQKIDIIRTNIEHAYKKDFIDVNEYYWLLASLLESSDKIANTASVYGAYLKNFKKSALKDLDFKLLPIYESNQNNDIYKEDANELIKKIKGNILYLDPPYNSRQYGANYHVLNRISEHKDFSSDKITGLIDYNKSKFSQKSNVFSAFEGLIKNADFEYIFISYNNEGLLKESLLKELLSDYGKYNIYKKEYKRFKADSRRFNKSDKTFEHLHVLIK